MTRPWSRRLVLLTLTAVMALGGVASGAPVPFGARVPVSVTDQTRSYLPEISGSQIVWTAMPFAGDTTTYIGTLDLATGLYSSIGLNDGRDQGEADVSSGRIAYQYDNGDDWDVHVYDSWLGVDIPLAETAADETGPRIDGNLVVWWAKSMDSLRWRDLARGTGGSVPDSSDTVAYDVDNGRIFWTVPGFSGGSVIRMFEPGVSGTSAEFIMNVSSDEFTSIRAHGHWIAYEAWNGHDYDAHFQEMRGYGSYHAAAGSLFNERRPNIFHKDSVWETDLGGTLDLLFRPLGGSVSNIAGDDTVPEYNASMFGRKVVYAVEKPMADVDIYRTSAAPEVVRTSGDDRYLTAIETSKAYFEGADKAVLCTGLNFPDALAAAPLARLVRGPLLLTRTDAVSPATMNELDRLGVETIWVIGGETVISPSVMTQLNDAGFTTIRIAGADRFETSTEIARAMDDMLVGAYGVRMAFFARGDNFPDALAVGPVAAGALSPIILVRNDEVPAVVEQAVDELGLTSGVIVGGADVVSNGVRDALRTLMIANGGDDHDPQIVDRWSGDTRYETAIAIVENGLAARWIDLDTLGFATGFNFPDALGGGAALGYYGSGLLLTTPAALPASVETFLDEQEYRIGRTDFFGGTDVVSDAVKTAVTAKLK